MGLLFSEIVSFTNRVTFFFLLHPIRLLLYWYTGMDMAWLPAAGNQAWFLKGNRTERK